MTPEAEAAHREPEPPCGERDGRWVCARPLGHDGRHADSDALDDEDRERRWPVEREAAHRDSREPIDAQLLTDAINAVWKKQPGLVYAGFVYGETGAAVAREYARLAAPSAPSSGDLPDRAFHDAAIGLLIAVDNALTDAFLNDEDGAEEPEWRDRLDKAADGARDVLTPPAARLASQSDCGESGE